MRRQRIAQVAPTPWRHCAARTREGTEGGFTLVEMLIVMVILPVVVGAITVSLVSVFSLQTGVSNHLSNSADAQVVSALFVHDVQSASMITTASSSSPQCGTPGTQLLGLESNLNPVTGVYETDISYAADTGDALVRSVCTSGSSSPTTTTTLIVHNLPSGQGSASISCSTTTTLTTALTAGVSSGNALNVSSLPESVSTNGDQIVVGSGLNTQTYIAGSAGAAVLASQIPIIPQTSNATYPIGTPVTDTSWSKINLCATSHWITSAGVLGVTLHVQVREATSLTASQASSYEYNLTAVPRTWDSASGGVLPGGAPPLLLLGNSPGELVSWNLPADLSCVGNGSINVDGEAVLDDSTINPAAAVTGGGSISATSFYTVAGTLGPLPPLMTTGGGQINSSEPPSTGPPLPDPYASLVPPTGGSPLPPTTSNGVTTYYPGVYTSPLTMTGNNQVVLTSGIYILDAGISHSGSGSVTSAAGGVLLYVSGGSVSFTGNGNVDLSPLTPPPSGLPANLVIWQAQSDISPIILEGSGGVGLISGTIYAPGALVGTTASGAFNALSVLAAALSCAGGGTIDIGFPVPAVTSVSPGSGPKAGGTAVTITGSGFVTGAIVSFGNKNATNVSVTSATTITVTSPNGPVGAADVTVTTPGGISPTSSVDQFHYQ